MASSSVTEPLSSLPAQSMQSIDLAKHSLPTFEASAQEREQILEAKEAAVTKLEKEAAALEEGATIAGDHPTIIVGTEVAAGLETAITAGPEKALENAVRNSLYGRAELGQRIASYVAEYRIEPDGTLRAQDGNTLEALARGLPKEYRDALLSGAKLGLVAPAAVISPGTERSYLQIFSATNGILKIFSIELPAAGAQLDKFTARFFGSEQSITEARTPRFLDAKNSADVLGHFLESAKATLGGSGLLARLERDVLSTEQRARELEKTVEKETRILLAELSGKKLTAELLSSKITQLVNQTNEEIRQDRSRAYQIVSEERRAHFKESRMNEIKLKNGTQPAGIQKTTSKTPPLSGLTTSGLGALARRLHSGRIGSATPISKPARRASGMARRGKIGSSAPLGRSKASGRKAGAGAGKTRGARKGRQAAPAKNKAQKGGVLFIRLARKKIFAKKNLVISQRARKRKNTAPLYRGFYAPAKRGTVARHRHQRIRRPSAKPNRLLSPKRRQTILQQLSNRRPSQNVRKARSLRAPARSARRQVLLRPRSSRVLRPIRRQVSTIRSKRSTLSRTRLARPVLRKKSAAQRANIARLRQKRALMLARKKGVRSQIKTRARISVRHAAKRRVTQSRIRAHRARIQARRAEKRRVRATERATRRRQRRELRTAHRITRREALRAARRELRAQARAHTRLLRRRVGPRKIVSNRPKGSFFKRLASGLLSSRTQRGGRKMTRRQILELRFEEFERFLQSTLRGLRIGKVVVPEKKNQERASDAPVISSNNEQVQNLAI